MPLDLVETLSQLVSLPSVNPMGRPLEGPEFFEYRVTDYLEGLFKRLGVPYVRQTLEPKRANIVARLDGSPGAHIAGPGVGGPDIGEQVLMLEAHQDTVPVDGMTIPPWTPTIANGHLYGRGSCDIKGGMTAMLVAFSRLVEERPTPRPTVIMACTVNEEHGYSGAADLEKLWTGPNPFMPHRPDAAVIAEPTLLNVVVAHKGTVRWRCKTRGRAAHSSQPHLGVNAVFRMAKILAALERYQQEVVTQQAHHRLCGRPTLSVGTITGGVSVNTVPDVCTIEIDRRLTPGETWEPAYRHVLDFLKSEGLADMAEHEVPYLQGISLSDKDNGPLGAKLALAAQTVVPGSQIIGVPFGTNASKIAAAGVPSVVFGPGSIDQAHTADEWVPLDQVHQAADILYQFAKTGL